MNDWTSGYVTEIGYTFGYYPELNPLRIRLALLNAGQVPPEVSQACELGFGQGLSVNLHAAASPVGWSGTDFNPSQVSFARELGLVAGSGVQLHDQGFEEFCARTDLPEFDFIGLHGIWSWISDDNRRVIVDFVRRKLKVGGVLYISYNTQPGWTSMLPMRELLTEHAEVFGVQGAGISSRIDAALSFAEHLVSVNPKHVRANPELAERMKRIKTADRHYLAHEYFNRDWQPMDIARMSKWWQPAKLQWACSAHYLDAVDGLNLTPEQQALLKSIPDPMFRQMVRDFCVNQQFRRDYWVKGARALNSFELADQLRMTRFILTQAREEVSLKATGALGEATLQGGVYQPILDALADHRPQSFRELEQALKDAKLGSVELLHALVVLCGLDVIQPAHEDAIAAEARPRTDRLNTHLMHKARGSAHVRFLASPVTGGGVPVPRHDQLFLLARQNGSERPEHWAQFAWSLMAVQGERMLRDGKPLETEADNLAELTTRARAFADKRLPVLKALQIA